jgi:Mor family transcriptional regulator
VNTEKYDDALVVLKEAVKDVCLENMNRRTLLRLQIGLQNQGKTFPFEVPHKVRNFIILLQVYSDCTWGLDW